MARKLTQVTSTEEVRVDETTGLEILQRYPYLWNNVSIQRDVKTGLIVYVFENKAIKSILKFFGFYPRP